MNYELYHHGIKGMKWGVKNGPPYPLVTGAKSKKELQADNKFKTKAIQMNAEGAIEVALELLAA